jgi:hypothetical protein
MNYDSDDNDEKIKKKFKEYKVYYNKLNQKSKNSLTLIEKKQQKITQEYLFKFVGNDNLYIHQNIYEGSNPSFLLLNLPEDQEGFMKFLRCDYLEKKYLNKLVLLMLIREIVFINLNILFQLVV